MNATPEIREKILKEISSTVLKILECNDPNDHRMALATGYIGGILKGLEIMGAVDIKDAQCLQKDILLFKKFWEPNPFARRSSENSGKALKGGRK